MSTARAMVLAGAVVALAACGSSSPVCVACSADADCAAGAVCKQGYCSTRDFDPSRCPARGSSSSGASSSSASSSSSSSGTASSSASSGGSSSSASSSGTGTSSGSSTSSGSGSSSGSTGDLCANVSCLVDACHPGVCDPSTGACVISVDAGCDDGNVCTTGDRCTTQGACMGAPVHDVIDRYIDSSYQSYAYAPDGGWNFPSWTDDGSIYASVPGGQPIYELFDSTTLDRILSFSTSQGSYSGGSAGPMSSGLATPEPGTVPLLVATFTCTAQQCNGATHHYFYTAGRGGLQGGGQDAGIFVCPP